MKSTLFIIWIVAITALSVVPYSNNVAISFKLTESGMVVHFMAYFVASALFYWAYGKKEDSGRRTPRLNTLEGDPSEMRYARHEHEFNGVNPVQLGREVRSQSTEIRVERVEGQGLRKEVSFIFLAGLLIFLFSVVLEIVQLYLPYRTFNPVDIAANGFGIGFFIICWAVFWKRGMRRRETQDKKGPQITPVK